MAERVLPSSMVRERSRALARAWVDAFAEHNLLTYASAVAFQTLIGAAALGFLFFALLAPLGLTTLWRSHMALPVAHRLPGLDDAAINYSVSRVLAGPHVKLVVIGSLMALWEVSGAMRAVIGALNRLYGIKEPRSLTRRFGVSFALAAAVSVLIMLAISFALAGGLLWSALGVPSAAGSALSWICTIALLWLVIAAVLLVAPARRQPWRWVSFGSVVIIVGWVLISLAYRYYVAHLAPFHSAEGALVTVLITTGYLYASAIVFLIGVELDQMLRENTIQRIWDAPSHR